MKIALKYITTTICLICILLSNAQDPGFFRDDITPYKINQIGGVSYHQDELYILIPVHMVFSSRDIEAKESTNIRQKYPNWEIYQYHRDGSLTNMNDKWPLKDASPNGFCIVDDKTVIYTNKKLKLVSNNPVLSRQLVAFQDKKKQYINPYYSPKNDRLYFSSDIDGSFGGMDLWYTYKRDYAWPKPQNMGKLINSTNNELGVSFLNDTIMVFSSNRTTYEQKGYEFYFADIKNNKPVLVDTKINSFADEVVPCMSGDSIINAICNEQSGDRLYAASCRLRLSDSLKALLAAREIEDLDRKDSHPKIDSLEVNPYEIMNFSITKYYGTSQYQLSPEMKDSLTGVAQKIMNNEYPFVLLFGHSSPDGSDYINMKLSYYRAGSAANWMLRQGTSSDRLFELYGGEYVFNEYTTGRKVTAYSMLYPLPSTRMVVYKLKTGETKASVMERFNVSEETVDHINSQVFPMLPVDKDNLILLPIKNMHFAEKGEEIDKIASWHNSTSEALQKTNNCGDVVNQKRIIYIPISKEE